MTETTTAANTETKSNDSVVESATAAAQSAAKTASTTVQDAAKTASATVQEAAKTASTTAQDAAKTVADTSSSLFTQAKDAIGQAVETTIEAVKEHPITAAAIGAGVAATVAGAAFGVSKLLEEDDTTATGKAKAKA